jgi:hypothetical protein
MGVDDYKIYDLDGDIDSRNQRMLQRHFPSQPLEPTFFMQPLDTKHQVFPTNDQSNEYMYRNHTEKLDHYPDFNPSEHFMPPTNVKAPWSGYIRNVDLETAMQHRSFANQRHCEQSEYVPPVESQLYNSREPFEHLPRGRNRQLYARSAETPDTTIAQTRSAWNTNSRLDFHLHNDIYREFGR